MTQSEQELEHALVEQLAGLGYSRVSIPDIDALEANLKTQLEKHNGITLSAREFQRVLNHLNKGSVFERAKTLRDRMQLTRDDGTSAYLQFLNSAEWCQNRYQVTHQITNVGRRKNRYDVTLLVNGLPLVQIELKRRGMEIKEAFNQINRYQRDSFSARHGLFRYVQIFVISNGVNTKYYANNRKQSFKQTFFWANEDNEIISALDAFANAFLEPCHLSKMICKYIVLHESDKVLMVLRPYQYYAVEAIIDRVKHSQANGYVWHATGSGKTLTSFKAAQLLTQLETVHKVMFVVDRADLDYQTSKEFNNFSEGSVNGTNNTRELVKQLASDSKLVVTTIQKLNTAISGNHHAKALEAIQDKPMVFIFDECHRSQFGETHKKIVKFFPHAQLIGFTGTPILESNAITYRTTKDLFGERLHSYLITNAIRDRNVLKFAVEYWGKLKRSDGSLIDVEVPSIDIKAFFDHEERLEQIVDWIIQHHDQKTHNRDFSAIFCVSSVDVLIKYYEIFQRKKEAGDHDLRIITVFTYKANEEDPEANGLTESPDFEVDSGSIDSSSRDKLERFVADYNAMYGSDHSVGDSKSFYTYYQDVAKRMKDRDQEGFADKDRADILLVVNMFLTGFDAKKVNTLYVDKNLKYHGLIQAYSRTNRILNEKKSQGNIVVFRNLKDATDDAIRLYSNRDAREEVLLEPYRYYVDAFNEGVAELQAIAQSPSDVDALPSEVEEVAFVKAFRDLLRHLNVLQSFTEFTFDDLALPEQSFVDYKSKYVDIHEENKHSNAPGASIVQEVDFELELIQRDEINVYYILQLLKQIKHQEAEAVDEGEASKTRDKVAAMLVQEVQLRSKRLLIEKFIAEQLPRIASAEEVEEAFEAFWSAEQDAAFRALVQEEGMNEEATRRLLSGYIISGKLPLTSDVLAAMETKPRLLARLPVSERIVQRLKQFVETFEDDLGM